jgi:hypothetical protein
MLLAAPYGLRDDKWLEGGKASEVLRSSRVELVWSSAIVHSFKHEHPDSVCVSLRAILHSPNLSVLSSPGQLSQLLLLQMACCSFIQTVGGSSGVAGACFGSSVPCGSSGSQGAPFSAPSADGSMPSLLDR